MGAGQAWGPRVPCCCERGPWLRGRLPVMLGALISSWKIQDGIT